MTATSTRSQYDVSAQAVLVLQSMTSHPSVSLLVPTPEGSLTPDLARRLQALRESAARRLGLEGCPSANRMLLGLDELIDQAGTVRLALHRTPRHVVLVLSAREARLFEGQLGTLQPADTSKFPMTARTDGRGGKRARTFLNDVDHALGAHLRLRPAPVVLIAAEPTLSAFRHSSRNLIRLAGQVAGNHLRTPLDELATVVAPLLESYLGSRQDEALTLLEQRRGQDRAVMGLESVWLASRWERPEMPAVEDDFLYPARISSDGDLLEGRRTRRADRPTKLACCSHPTLRPA